jgi:glycosyltransferase involved in cell wall biosynthesis
MFSIALLQDNHNHPAYRGASLRAGGLGGTESSVIQLAEALAARGHTVYALNRLDLTVQERGVMWMPLRDMKALPPIDVAIGVNSTRIFSGLRARKKITWLHNPPKLRQQLKRRNLFALLRHRPHAVLLGEYHSGLLHSWLPYSDRSIIFHGVADNFFLGEPERAPRLPRAIFASQPKRGLAFVTEAWAEIRARAPDAELHVFCPQAKEREAAEACRDKPGVVIRGSVSRAQLSEELRAARVMLIPGVADETYCLAAAEATAAGVPIVTRGAGALAERVVEGNTGFISPATNDFIRDAVRLLTEDDLWLKMHASCVGDPALATWNERAADWEAVITKIGVW